MHETSPDTQKADSVLLQVLAAQEATRELYHGGILSVLICDMHGCIQIETAAAEVKAREAAAARREADTARREADTAAASEALRRREAATDAAAAELARMDAALGARKLEAAELQAPPA